MANRFFGDNSDSPPARSQQQPVGDGTTRRPPRAQPTDAGAGARRIALLIGNAAYPAGKLRNPVNDVELVGAALRKLTFDVEVLRDAGKAQLEHAIVAFGAKLADAGGDAISVFYFAGHGIQSQGQNFLIPVDARIPEARFLRSGAIRVDFLLEELAQAKSRANLIILDACRNNPIPVASAGADALRGLAVIEAIPDATGIVFSTAAGAEAADGAGANSPYATALAQSLSRSGVSLHDIVFETASAVAKATGGRQRPALFVQGALPDVSLDAPSPRPEPAAGNKGPWGRLVDDSASEPLPAAPADWTIPDPELTHETPIPFGVLRYGLSGTDWQQGFPGDLVNEVISTGRWPEVETGYARREPYAATLIAIRSMAAIRPDWGRPDLELAARAAMIGATAGIRQAFIVLGWLHEVGGGGFPRDPPVDRAILAALAERGYRFAELQFGIRLALGVDERPAPAEAIGWLEKAAAKGANAALYEIGRLYTDRVRVPYVVNFEKARHYLERAAESGHVAAASELACLYLDGKIDNADRSEAIRWLDIAAGAGNATALYRRGMVHEHGDGLAPNLTKATADYAAAARAGSTDAMLALAFHATHGSQLAPADPAEAVKWNVAAADKGSAVAHGNLGHFYETGFGVAVSAAKAGEHYAAAAHVAAGHIGLARLAMRGPGGPQPMARIEQLLAPVLTGGDHGARRYATAMIAQVAMHERLVAVRGVAEYGNLDDITIGSAQAPVSLVVFQSVADAACARFHVEVTATIRDRFVASGHVRIVFREALADRVAGVAALIRGAPPSARLAIMERLLSSQDAWAGPQAAPSALACVLADLGYDEAATWAATTNHHLLSKVLYLSGKVAKDLGVQEVPTVFVNGRMLARPGLAAVEVAIIEALPPEFAFALNGGSTFGIGSA